MTHATRVRFNATLSRHVAAFLLVSAAYPQTPTYRGQTFESWEKAVAASSSEAILRARALLALQPNGDRMTRAVARIAADFDRWSAPDLAKCLAKMTPTGARALLIRAEKGTQGQRSTARWALARAGSTGVAWLLKEVARPGVHVGMFSTGDESTARDLADFLTGDDAQIMVALQAAWVLRKNGIDLPPSLQRRLPPLLERRHEQIRSFATSLLDSAAPVVHLPFLRRLLRERAPRTARRWASAICSPNDLPASNWTPREATHLELLRRLLRAPTEAARRTGAILLGDIRATAAETDLWRLARDRNRAAQTRISAIESLCLIRPPASSRDRELARLLRIVVGKRDNCTWRLKILGSRALPSIMNRFRYRPPNESDGPLLNLSELGVRARPALPKMLAALDTWPRINALAAAIVDIDPSLIHRVESKLVEESRKPVPALSNGPSPGRLLLRHGCISAGAVNFYIRVLSEMKGYPPDAKLIELLAKAGGLGHDALRAHVRDSRDHPDTRILTAMLDQGIDAQPIEARLRRHLDNFLTQLTHDDRHACVPHGYEDFHLTAELLGTIPRDVSKLSDLLASPRPTIRMAGVRGLLPRSATSPETRKKLLPELLRQALAIARDEHKVYRVSPASVPEHPLARRLARWGGALAAPLTLRLKGPDANIRKSTLATFRWLGTAASDALPRIAACLGSDDEEEQQLALRCLHAIPGALTQCASSLQGWLSSRPRPLDRWQTHFLGGLIERDSDWLIDCIERCRPTIAKQILAIAESRKEVKIHHPTNMLSALRTEVDIARKMAAALILKSTITPSFEDLRKLAKGSWHDRGAAAALLAKLKPTLEVRQLVKAMLEDDDRWVRAQARATLR